MTSFDELCIFSGITYCKKGYLRCLPHICRGRRHMKKDRVEHPRTKKIVQLPDFKMRIK